MGSEDQDQSQDLHGYASEDKRAARTLRRKKHNRSERKKPPGNQEQKAQEPHSESPHPGKVNMPARSRRWLK
jgi:hypothetical protein